MKVSIKGVVVKEVNYGESDKILTVLTAEDGIISVIAKRCRNLKNKSGDEIIEDRYNKFRKMGC